MRAAGLKVDVAFLAGDFIVILMAMKINLSVGPSLAAEMAAIAMEAVASGSRERWEEAEASTWHGMSANCAVIAFPPHLA